MTVSRILSDVLERHLEHRRFGENLKEQRNKTEDKVKTSGSLILYAMSVLTYVADTWTIRQKDMGTAQSLKCFRRILNLKYYYKVSNEKILTKIGQNIMQNVIREEAKLVWT